MNKTSPGFLRHFLVASLALALLAVSACGHNPFEPPTVFGRAQAVRLEIKQGQFAKVEKQIGEMLAQTRIGPWRFAPFTTFVGYVSAPSDQKFAEQLDAWVKQSPKSPSAHLIRANYHYNRGWWFRGNGFSNQVDAGHYERFRKELAQASNDVDDLVQLAPDDPYAWQLRLLIARDTQGDSMQEAAFKTAIARFPDYFPLYMVRLGSLQPKWGGSTDAMKAFVKQYAGAAPASSPLKALNLFLYARLLNNASLNCDHANGGALQDACVTREMAQTADAMVTQDAYDAIRILATREDLGAVWEVEAALRSMAMTPGGSAYAVEFLQTAADALYSDPQLVTDKAGNNHYVIDKLAAYIWYEQGNDANALSLDRRALEELANTRFSSQAVADDVRAGIYRDMLTTYARQGDNPQAAAYGKQMAMLSGGYGAAFGYDTLTCEALYRMQQYSSALEVCSAAIEASDDLQAHFFRARVHDSLKQNSQAMADYLIVANSSAATEFRTSSVIQMAIVSVKGNKPMDALNTMNRFSGLFVEGRATRTDLAIYYNNRCYFNMQLGRLEPALEDCNTSLRYGHILDAVSKQQKLLRQLGSATVTSGGKAVGNRFH
jgi:tetratricopeptide (TPR) repeat protein